MSHPWSKTLLSLPPSVQSLTTKGWSNPICRAYYPTYTLRHLGYTIWTVPATSQMALFAIESGMDIYLKIFFAKYQKSFGEDKTKWRLWNTASHHALLTASCPLSLHIVYKRQGDSNFRGKWHLLAPEDCPDYRSGEQHVTETALMPVCLCFVNAIFANNFWSRSTTFFPNSKSSSSILDGLAFSFRVKSRCAIQRRQWGRAPAWNCSCSRCCLHSATQCWAVCASLLLMSVGVMCGTLFVLWTVACSLVPPALVLAELVGLPVFGDIDGLLFGFVHIDSKLCLGRSEPASVHLADWPSALPSVQSRILHSPMNAIWWPNLARAWKTGYLMTLSGAYCLVHPAHHQWDSYSGLPRTQAREDPSKNLTDDGLGGQGNRHLGRLAVFKSLVNSSKKPNQICFV